MGFEDEDNIKKTKIPVKKVGDRLEFLFGGDVPLRDGCIGHLIVPIDDIEDETFKNNLLIEKTVQILPAGTKLLMGMTEKNRIFREDTNYPVDLYYLSTGITHFEPVELENPVISSSSNLNNIASVKSNGGLWLSLKGVDHCEIKSGSVKILNHPDIDKAFSLNHAYTLLSEKIEKHRISHTGNIYKRCYYQEKNGKWYPLKLLRDNVNLEIEISIIDATWNHFQNTIGWTVK
jgi:hypothetical protein